MSFNNKKYTVVRNAISKELANFVLDYLNIKSEAVKYIYSNRIVKDQHDLLGTWKDTQCPGVYSCYGDWAMETLLKKLHPLMERETEKKLVINYSYCRIYKKGSILDRHKDRPSCEISTTLNLGGDVWPIFLEPNKNVGPADTDGLTISSNNEGIPITLNQGDMLIYNGVDLEHWREKFKGDSCTQVFLHYANKFGDFGNQPLDKRPLLGIPKTT